MKKEEKQIIRRVPFINLTGPQYEAAAKIGCGVITKVWVVAGITCIKLFGDDNFYNWINEQWIIIPESKARAEIDALRKANAELADLFKQELAAYTDAMGGIVNAHITPTLVSLFYLEQAIRDDCFIECVSDESRVLDVVCNLPSCERWFEYIKDA